MVANGLLLISNFVTILHLRNKFIKIMTPTIYARTVPKGRYAGQLTKLKSSKPVFVVKRIQKRCVCIAPLNHIMTFIKEKLNYGYYSKDVLYKEK